MSGNSLRSSSLWTNLPIRSATKAAAAADSVGEKMPPELRRAADGSSAARQTPIIDTFARATDRRRRMSPASLLTTSASCRIASAATEASTTSFVRVFPSSEPAVWAAGLSNGTTSHPRSRRLIGACFGERLACATTGVGTSGMIPASNRTRCSAQVRRSERSAAIKTPVSYTTGLIGQSVSVEPCFARYESAPLRFPAESTRRALPPIRQRRRARRGPVERGEQPR